MRLLHTSTLRFHEFSPEDVSYAILSHTWGAEEVTFHELTDLFDEDGCQCGKTNRRAKILAKAGYKKILACCRQARRDNLEYFWIDTCCIDRSSSAELSEAINSMWQWYKRSCLCYVYLQDVEPQVVQSPADFEKALAKCRWITRGWCLQELLAPLNVVFLARDWSALGLKCGLSSFHASGYDLPQRYWNLSKFTKQISSVTHIPEVALAGGFKSSRYSIAQKMSWAADRETTRIEDRAYSLMGLFDTNMPLLYGEGSRAFFRLQEELIRSQADHSIFAFRSSKRGMTSVLAQSPLGFKFYGNIMAPNRDLDPYRMTNRGLEIELDVGIWHDRSYYVALLECFDRDGNQIAIILDGRAALSDSKVGTAVYRAPMGGLYPTSLDRAAIEEIEKLGSFRRRKLLISRKVLVR